MIKYEYSLPFGLELIDDFTVKKMGRYSLIESIKQFEIIINHFINHPDPLVVPIYSYQYISGNNKSFYIYSYTMKRLGLLSEEEKKIISLCIRSKLDTDKDFCRLKEEYSSLIHFMDQVLTQNRYVDLHNRNFLKDEEGNYKIIDIEGFLKYPVDYRNLDWIINANG
jgi:hypothetical protein